jgi:hypothetical protein
MDKTGWLIVMAHCSGLLVGFYCGWRLARRQP